MSFGWTTTRSTPSSVRQICCSTVIRPWPDLGRRGVHGRHRLPAGQLQPHPGGRVVVEALGEGHVLVRDGVTDAADDTLAVRRVVHRAGQRPQVGGLVAFRRQRQVGDDLQQLADRGRGVDDLPGDVPVALAHAVALPDLDAVDAHRVGELVHQRLVREGGLHAPEPAHRPARRVVGEHPVRVDRHRREPVGAEAQGAAVPDDRTGRGGVGAAVEEQARLRVDQRAVALGAELVGHRRRMPVHVAVEGFLAPVAHLHRLAGAQRQQAGVHVHRQVLAAAERAADAGQHRAAPSRAACRVPGRSGAGRRAATGWRRRGRSRRPRPGRRARTRGRGRPGPACRPRSRARPRPAPSGPPLPAAA